MAATDYYAPGTRPRLESQNSGLYPPPPMQRASSSQASFGNRPAQPGHPSPQFGAVQSPSPYAAPPPPPYQPLNAEPKVHFAQPPPTSAPGQHRPSVSYSLNQPNFNASQGQQLSPYPPGPYVPQGAYQPQQPYVQSQSQTNYRSSFSDPSGPGYSSDPEHQRRKHKSRPRRVSDNSRSTKSDALLGAAGGGLIGDLIFPGLGTVGGALVGWIGGKDYGKHRKWREEKRDREQERWERRYQGGDSGSDRSRSRSRDDRDRDSQGSRYTHIGKDGIPHSHTRRKSHD
ncbi:hypothetical protein H2200_002722 [Cladophialophora chaetospira]|uniref:PRP38-assoc multi-domain protein n=1 Tax=Cladophialophora chaetospira TaxID=386627 RepID=A0AA39CNU3_9EURO|nr:hypothetical protein H2200_002722 [Cladophialophora chaetospira]